MSQFASIAVGDRLLDHEYLDGIGDYWSHGGCAAMVLRNGGGDQCGRRYREHWKPWVWLGQRNNSADPAGQDFDWNPTFDPEPQHNPVNPVIAALRKEWRENDQSIFTIDMWSAALTTYEVFGGYSYWEHPDHPYHAILTATNEERAHALTILERLVVLHEEEL